jgi:hypothetical protein
MELMVVRRRREEEIGGLGKKDNIDVGQKKQLFIVIIIF